MLAGRSVPPRPVVVIGNLVAGGAGKTPATIAIAQALSERGWHPGLLCRGYRARRTEPRLVGAHDDAAEHGDEAVLLARATGLPVAAGRERIRALELLRASHPEIDVVLCDDGLQHEALARSVELVVFDRRGIGNGQLLPAGPLREPVAHLATMDAVLLNGDAAAPPGTRLPAFRFDVVPAGLRSLADGSVLSAGEFLRRVRGRSVVAIAGLADPSRFFSSLRALGIRAREVPLPDHAPVDRALVDAQNAPFVVMTEKDAVKLRDDADERCWVLQVQARVDPALIDWLVERLRGQPIA